MRDLLVLYICTKEEPIVLKVLTSQFSVCVYHIGVNKGIENRSWDLVIFQDSDMWDNCSYHKLKKYPLLFISTCVNIRGYIAPIENLFGVINIGGADLSLWGVPQELQRYLQKPVMSTADHYFYERQPEICRIVYCPTGNNVCENDFKLLSFIRTTNAVLTIISDKYRALADAFPSLVEIVSPKLWLSVFKNAHVVIASGYYAIAAMALCKPCVIMGDFGLGGLVTSDNYEQLQSISFMGRKGASFGEMVPYDLLEIEIGKVFMADYDVSLQVIQKKVSKTYDLKSFSVLLLKEVRRIVDLSIAMKSVDKRMDLKPIVSSVFCQEEFEGKRYIVRGLQYLGELDEEMCKILKQCDGIVSIRDLVIQNEYDSENASVLWWNLYELWKKKLILFEL